MRYTGVMTAFPKALKTWRKARRFSQLDLALEANVSSRHISFLETGRARPSADMIRRLVEALDLPLASRNAMLTLAGFAAPCQARPWDTPEMAPIRAAVDYMLVRHAPYPALAIDKLWVVLRMNAPAKRLFGLLGLGEGGSLLDLMGSDHLPSLVENWPEVANHVAQRLRLESAAQGGVAALDRVAEKLAQVPGAPKTAVGPVIPTILRNGPLRLSLFATIAQFGSAEDLTLDALKIEMYFPVDAATDAALKAIAAEMPMP